MFCKVNGEVRSDQMQAYGAQGFPAIFFLRPDGSVVHQIGGYEPLDAFLNDMQVARNKG